MRAQDTEGKITTEDLLGKEFTVLTCKKLPKGHGYPEVYRMIVELNGHYFTWDTDDMQIVYRIKWYGLPAEMKFRKRSK